MATPAGNPVTAQPREHQRQASSRYRSWRFWLLALAAGQYMLLQLLTGIEYGDAPRNLHWGLYTLEEPRFLLDVEDRYDRVDGFPPAPAQLATRGKRLGVSTPLHPWWGPLYPLMFAGIWAATGSYMLLQLIVPLAAGATVLLVYRLGTRYFSQRAAWLATLLLAFFPIYREHAPMTYTEPLSALFLTATLWAFVARRTALCVLLAALTLLGKVDMIPLYFGTVFLTGALSWRDPAQPLPRRHLLLCLVLPALALLPWLYLSYVISDRPATIAGAPNLSSFGLVAPMMLEQFFTIRWYGAIATLALLGYLAGRAVRRQETAPPLVYRMLGCWLALGVFVLLIYTATPGASNNPRVFIPALPPLCLLVADGLERLHRRRRGQVLLYLGGLFLVINMVTLLVFQLPLARRNRGLEPVWDVLRQRPQGYVMTEHYWHAVLYAQQPATWFEGDLPFQNNILQNKQNFRRYVADHPIRYVVVPADNRSQGRPLLSPEVRAYLEQRAQPERAGDYLIYTLGAP